MKNYLPVLRDAPLFAGLSDDEILSALQCVGAEQASFPPECTILYAGDRTGHLGLLLDGTALVVQEDIWGNRHIVTVLRPGELFAEPFALLPEAVLNVSVLAQEGCTILRLRVQALITVCPSSCSFHNRLIQNLTTILAQKLLQLNEKLSHLSRRKTREKLLSYLSAEATRQGSRDFTIPYDRQQLADYLCVDRAAMSVELSRLQQEGILSTHRSRFRLLEGE